MIFLLMYHVICCVLFDATLTFDHGLSKVTVVIPKGLTTNEYST